MGGCVYVWVSIENNSRDILELQIIAVGSRFNQLNYILYMFGMYVYVYVNKQLDVKEKSVSAFFVSISKTLSKWIRKL